MTPDPTADKDIARDQLPTTCLPLAAPADPHASDALTDQSDGCEPATGGAPTFPSLVANVEVREPERPALPAPGQRLDDFELLSILGAGSFAKVFLARQVSLNRLVALKVSANRGSEARTLASLEHDHIVHVFTETVDRKRDLRLMCMQYLPGTNLERVICALAQRPRAEWSGRAILEAIDQLSTDSTAFDPAALRDREILASCDFMQAVCWIGARLAEALAHAHRQGVFHRDIKPANILMNRYGRPLIADFNIALDPQRAKGARGSMFGGTLAYMAPEHLDAFNPDDPTPPDAVDQRSDIYSLGIVLFELLTGRRPFASAPQDVSTSEALRSLAAARRSGAPAPRREQPDVPEVLDRAVRRCLDPQPERRYQKACELAQALEGCRELRRIDKELPDGDFVTRANVRHPFILLVVLTLLPHFVGSVVNISYNSVRIVSDLTVAQQGAFNTVVLAYNAIIYTVCLWLCYRLITPVVRTWRRLSGPALPEDADVAACRRRVLRLPFWAIVLSCVGWLPGGLFFPMALQALAGPVRAEVFGHFLVSFTISGLIALTYSALAVQFVVLRAMYPRLWVDGRGLRELPSQELGSLRRRLSILQLLAGLIPLAGAVMMVGVGPEQLAMSSYKTFRLLVTALIALGMLGFSVAQAVSSRIGQTLVVLTGSERR